MRGGFEDVQGNILGKLVVEGDLRRNDTVGHDERTNSMAVGIYFDICDLIEAISYSFNHVCIGMQRRMQMFWLRIVSTVVLPVQHRFVIFLGRLITVLFGLLICLHYSYWTVSVLFLFFLYTYTFSM